MAKAVKTGPCPKCRERGQDRRGDNLHTYEDGGCHCFSCGYHRNGKFQLTFVNEEKINDYEKAVLPRVFTRQVPAEGWKWLLQYGLSYSYWKAHCGYSEEENRLVFTVGTPIKFSTGRALTVGDKHKWRHWGNVHSYVECLSEELPGPVVLVEDLISAHKVAQVASCICLFGTNVHDMAVKKLQALGRPVVLWLDEDQYQLLPKKIHRLQTLLRHPVTYVKTRQDPKLLSLDEIKEQLK